jgi:hypothetical protein
VHVTTAWHNNEQIKIKRLYNVIQGLKYIRLLFNNSLPDNGGVFHGSFSHESILKDLSRPDRHEQGHGMPHTLAKYLPEVSPMVEMVLNLLGREGEEELPPCAKAEIDASIEKEPVIPWDFGG